MNTFLIGSKDLFEKLKLMVELLSQSIDIKINATYKMIELENRRISYMFTVDIAYPSQMFLGLTLERKQIDLWFSRGIDLFLSELPFEKVKLGLNNIVNDIELNSNFLYVGIPVKLLEKSLEDYKKLSILLFKKLDFFKR